MPNNSIEYEWETSISNYCRNTIELLLIIETAIFIPGKKGGFLNTKWNIAQKRVFASFKFLLLNKSHPNLQRVP